MTSHDFGPLVLGGNTFGWSSSRDESFAVLDAFVAAGGRAIDTADVYSAWAPGHSGGESETVLGEWLARRGRRDDVEIHTKVFALETRPGLSAANIRAAVDDSLRRLQTDHLDLYYAHRDDPDVAQEEYVAAFGELVTAGKIRAVGASNFTAGRLRSAIAIAADLGVTPFTVSQDGYSLVRRDFEVTLRDTIAELGLIELPYGALQGGFLTGKYRAGVTVDSVRAGNATKLLDDPRNLALLDALDQVADARRASIAAVALAWLRQQPAVGAPIASARTVEQLPDLVESFTLELTADELEVLSAPTTPLL